MAAIPGIVIISNYYDSYYYSCRSQVSKDTGWEILELTRYIVVVIIIVIIAIIDYSILILFQ